MRRIVSAALGLWIAVAGAGHAQVGNQRPVVLELFTSQGCSSCPPADAFLAELAPRDDVIALALHVDYWDYIGWTDSFARPAFTERQKDYARAVGANSIYTPQMVIGGSDRIEGYRVMQVSDLIRRHRDQAGVVELALSRTGVTIEIRAEAEPPLSSEVTVQFVRYVPSRTVMIESGENAGRRVTYHNIVTAWDVVGRWDGQAPLRMSVSAEGDEPVVVILQKRGMGRIVAAQRLR